MKVNILYSLKTSRGLLITALIVAFASFLIFSFIIIRHNTRNSLVEMVSEDALIYAQIKKPIFLFPWQKNNMHWYNAFKSLDAIMGWDIVFEKDLFPLMDDEASLFIASDATSTPIVLLTLKRGITSVPDIQGFKFIFIEKNIIAIAKSETSFNAYVRVSSGNSLGREMPEEFYRYAPFKMYVNVKKINEIGVFSDIFGKYVEEIDSLVLLSKYHDSVWNFSIYPKGKNTYEEVLIPQNMRMSARESIADSVYIHGIGKTFLKNYLESLWSRNIRSEDFMEKNFLPLIDDTMDIAIRKDETLSQLHYLIYMRVISVEEGVIIDATRDMLSYFFPYKLEKILYDDAVIFEEVARPESIHIEYADSHNKVFSFQDSIQEPLYFFHDGKDVMISNNKGYLDLHIAKLRQGNEIEGDISCDEQNASSFIYLGENFYRDFITASSGNPSLLDIIEDVLIWKGIYVSNNGQRISGCVL